MKTTDQIVAEAAKKCLKWVEGDDPFPPEAYGKCEQIIQSAIEKAAEASYESRASHASEQVAENCSICGEDAIAMRCNNEFFVRVRRSTKCKQSPICITDLRKTKTEAIELWNKSQQARARHIPDASSRKIPETLPCPSCGARDHDLEIKVGLLKARTSEQGADTKRLEFWLDHNYQMVDNNYDFAVYEGPRLITKWFKTKREAIDAAMSQLPTKKFSK